MRKQRTRLRLLFFLTVILFGHPHFWGWVTGAVLIVVGSLLHLLAAGYLRKKKELCTAGPYRFVRNPIYLADFFRDLGYLLACHSCLEIRCIPLWVFGGLYFGLMFGWLIRRRVLAKEEPALVALFGQDFRRYCQQVPRFLPRIWPAPRSGEARFSLENLRLNGELPRFLVMAVIVGITFYKWKALHYQFALEEIVSNGWELSLLATLPVLILVSKVRGAGLERYVTSRAGLLGALPAIVLWFLVLFLADYAQIAKHQNAFLTWELGPLLVFAGWLLRQAGLRGQNGEARPGPPPPPLGGFSPSYLTAALGSLIVMVGVTVCAETLWLLPNTLCTWWVVEKVASARCTASPVAVSSARRGGGFSSLPTRPAAKAPAHAVALCFRASLLAVATAAPFLANEIPIG